MQILLSSAYLPPVQYFAHLQSAEQVWIEQYDHYQKQTYRNRCVIAAPDGPLSLTVPIEKPNTQKAFMRDIRISDHGNWRHLHWNAIESAYNHTPFFEYYKDDFRPFYEKKFDFLVDYNEQLCQLVCQLIDIDTPFQRTESYITEPSNTIIDLRDAIHPKKEVMDDASFSAVPYYQVFQEKLGFLPNLSIIDLLFNMGPEAILVLQKSIK
ncbi:MAG: WbqC family protein [Bacteroides sp.]|nr:WbqC family protein [Bacteroides sp.]